jgi:hypothetical protein
MVTMQKTLTSKNDTALAAATSKSSDPIQSDRFSLLPTTHYHNIPTPTDRTETYFSPPTDPAAPLPSSHTPPSPPPEPPSGPPYTASEQFRPRTTYGGGRVSSPSARRRALCVGGRRRGRLRVSYGGLRPDDVGCRRLLRRSDLLQSARVWMPLLVNKTMGPGDRIKGGEVDSVGLGSGLFRCYSGRIVLACSPSKVSLHALGIAMHGGGVAG